jgi:hypothetical protein
VETRIGDRTALVLAAALAVLLLAAAALTGDRAHAAPAGWGAGAERADAKRSCIYTRNDLVELRRFQRSIGRRYSCAMVFSNANPTWREWEMPWILVHPDERYRWADWVRAAPGRRLILTFTLVPDRAPADWRARGARGRYDRHARRLARNLVRAGLGASVVRLSPEMNGTWTRDHVGSTRADFRNWRRYWGRVVRAMRSVPGAAFTFDFNVAAGYRAIPFEQYYPGDGVVDIFGFDLYDDSTHLDVAMRPGRARWEGLARRRYGFRDAIAFARAHGKPISIPEWGLAKVDPDRGGLGDNPDFVRRLARLVRATPIVYQAYFENDSGLALRLRDAPRSRAVYRALLSPRRPRG